MYKVGKVQQHLTSSSQTNSKSSSVCSSKHKKWDNPICHHGKVVWISVLFLVFEVLFLWLLISSFFFSLVIWIWFWVDNFVLFWLVHLWLIFYNGFSFTRLLYHYLVCSGMFCFDLGSIFHFFSCLTQNLTVELIVNSFWATFCAHKISLSSSLLASSPSPKSSPVV